MENVEYSEKFLRERKLAIALPVLVVPFLTMLFWAFGGAKANGTNTNVAEEKGLNMVLPSAKEKDEKITDKLALYDKATRDSMDLRGRLSKDPYYQEQFGQNPNSIANTPSAITGHPQFGYQTTINGDPAEARVYERLNVLNNALNQPVKEPGQDLQQIPRSNVGGVSAADIDRLQAMMLQMQDGKEEDQETKQLNGMLERILDIQHPERVKERLKAASTTNKGRVFPVSGVAPTGAASVLDSQASVMPSAGGAGFFGEERFDESPQQNAIEAVVHETQTVSNGSVIKLRLTGDLYVSGMLIPKGQFVFGTVSLSGERLVVSIENIRYSTSLLPVKLVVFDIDGLAGIRIPGAITRDVAKESGERGLQGIGMSSLDPSLGAQAASAGIEVTKNLLSRKIKLVKVTVKAGYRVLLKDENNKEY